MQKHNHLQLVYSKDAAQPAAPAPAATTYVQKLLFDVLKAKLTPTLTVEDACHHDMTYTDDVPPVEAFLAHFQLLRAAGLDIQGPPYDAPSGIVLYDAYLFKLKFPHLEASIAPMLAHCGVIPYTFGMPRVAVPVEVPPTKPKRCK